MSGNGYLLRKPILRFVYVHVFRRTSPTVKMLTIFETKKQNGYAPYSKRPILAPKNNFFYPSLCFYLFYFQTVAGNIENKVGLSAITVADGIDLYLPFYCVQYWSLLNWQNLRLRCGSCKKNFFTLFQHFSLNLRTLYIVWSLVRRRVTRRLTRLQAMCNVIKYRKIL